jgi:LmbE family N-acetylglucosaminyl deacetylase
MPVPALEVPRFRRALVLAPHYDDEVLGCGGLLARLAAQGAAVKVLFLTDGSGGVEEVGDRSGYAARRRAESQVALQILGVSPTEGGSEHLGLPDGRLAQHGERLAQAVDRALLAGRPDLVLAPSPLEATEDHQAAFWALHRVLGAVRAGDALEAVARDLEVWLYEVNHPGYPDVLVDVEGQLPALERAMAAYASQEERHAYWRAGLGLRRYRALSLPPDGGAVEAFRRLRASELQRVGPHRLLAELGGAVSLAPVESGPPVSVIVRTKDRPHWLAEALRSLDASSYRRTEIVLVNDGGAPPQVAPLSLPVVRVDLATNRGRAAAANAGVEAASGEFVAFLDDDDLVEPDHLEVLAGLVCGSGVPVVYSDAAVGVYELGPEGWQRVERRLPYSRDFDPDLLALDNYIPFNTLLMRRDLVREAGPFDPELPFFEDWDFLLRLASRTPFHHHRRVTCEYRHFRGTPHHVLGERARERPDFLAMKVQVLTKHRSRLTPELLARAADVLRSEAVGATEDAAQARQQWAAAEKSFHAVNGALDATRRHLEMETAARTEFEAETVRLGRESEAHRAQGDALRGELASRDRELQRLYDAEGALRSTVDDQGGHIGRLYAEIERLNGAIRGMEATRAWRLRARWLRWFGN